MVVEAEYKIGFKFKSVTKSVNVVLSYQAAASNNIEKKGKQTIL
jgi:hypothetical protein